jgi:hypothetical protein
MDVIQLNDKSLSKIIVSLLPWACIILPLLALTGLLIADRSDLMLSGIYLFLGVFLAGVVTLLFPRPFQRYIEVEESKVPATNSVNSFLFFTLLFIVSIILLIRSDNRPLLYFILIASMSCNILWQIQFKKSQQTTFIIIGQMVLLSLNLAWGQTLKLPFYFGDGDLLYHFKWVGAILDSGHVTALLGDYQYFPLLHILNTELTLLSSGDIKTVYFMLSGLMFTVSIPLTYLLVKLVTHNSSLALSAALIYTVSREFMYYEMYTLTRTMAFVICVMILYLLLCEKHRLKCLSLAIFLILPLVVTHQITLIIFTFILILIVILGVVLYRRWDYIPYSFPVLFTVTYLGYWFYLATAFLDLGFSQLINTDNIVSLPQSGGLKLPWQAHLFNNLDYLIIEFLAILGVIALMRSAKERNKLQILSLLALIGLSFFLPGPSNYILPLTLAYRVPILVLPFIALASGAAIWFIMQQRLNGLLTGYVSSVMAAFLLIIYSFVTPVLLSGQTDVDLSGITGLQNKKYFTQAELSALVYTAINYAGLSGITDLSACNYLSNYLGIPGVSKMIYMLNPDSMDKGYFLFRSSEYKTRRQLPFLYFERGTRDVVLNYKAGIDDSVFSSWWEQDKVFDNGATELYYKYQ